MAESHRKKWRIFQCFANGHVHLFWKSCCPLSYFFPANICQANYCYFCIVFFTDRYMTARILSREIDRSQLSNLDFIFVQELWIGAITTVMMRTAFCKAMIAEFTKRFTIWQNDQIIFYNVAFLFQPI